MSYAHLCDACGHLASRHLLGKGGDLRAGPYRCLDCECFTAQDAPSTPASEGYIRELEERGFPTYRTAAALKEQPR